MKDIKDLSKGKDIPYSWTKRQCYKKNKFTIRKYYPIEKRTKNMKRNFLGK